MIYGALHLRLMLFRRSPKVILQHSWQTNYPHISFLSLIKQMKKKSTSFIQAVVPPDLIKLPCLTCEFFQSRKVNSDSIRALTTNS